MPKYDKQFIIRVPGERIHLWPMFLSHIEQQFTKIPSYQKYLCLYLILDGTASCLK